MVGGGEKGWLECLGGRREEPGKAEEEKNPERRKKSRTWKGGRREEPGKAEEEKNLERRKKRRT